ncbi:hypothetical protein [uncultured Veillonella sp.]|uniref:hypothetical protein n=1 Tax=uncultured Veillonella sp. TaxID=159268 RepID=UPI0025E25365|nr:hypothetical protein [uncultured Veillonella sp.]
MKVQSKKMTKFVAAMLVGVVGTGLYSADAAGLAGSYVGIGTAPTDATVVKSGSEYNAKDIVGSSKLIDYRQTTNSQGNAFERIPTNNNENGEGVDGTATANDSRKGIGTTAIGFGTYASRGYATAIGTYSSAIGGSTAVGAGTYAGQYSSAFGRNAYANSKGIAVGDAARAADGLAIGVGASAGQFYKYIQSNGTQNHGAIINSIAIGPDATAVGGTAIGAKAQTNSLYGVALGQGSKVSYNGVALGVNAQVTAKGNGGIALGTSSVANRGAGKIGYMPLVDGVKGEVAANDSRLAEVMGLSDDIKNFTTTYANEISEYNQLNKKYSDIQSQQEAQKQIMIATKGNDDAAYKAAKAEYDKLSKEAVAATDARNAWTASHQDFTQAMAKQQSALAAFKATDGAVSVGSDAYVDAKTGKTIQNTRQIINVAAGTEDTDAVNVAQLKAVEKTTADKVSSFTVGNGPKAAEGEEAPATITVDNENTHFDIMGANGNITTEVDQNGRAIKVGLANTLNLGSNGSISFGDNGTKLDGNGLTIVNGPSITNDGINAGGKTITNVGNGSIAAGSKDAVTGGQIYEEIQKITGENGALNGKADSNLSNITEAGKTVINNISTEAAQKAVTVKSGDAFVNVELNAAEKEKGVNQYDVSLNKDTLRDALGTGKNEAGNKDLVTGDTLHEAISNVVAGQASDEHITNLAQKAIDIKDGENTTVTSKTEDGVKTYQVNVSDEAIKPAVKPELDQKANLDGSNLTPDAITNWKDQLGVTNEVSGLNNRVDGLESNVSNLNNRVNKLDQRVDKVGAGAAALAGIQSR